MSDHTKPSYEQLAVDLRANQVAVDVARAQRNSALDEIADLRARLDQAMTVIQARQVELTNLHAQLDAAQAPAKPADKSRRARKFQ